MAHIGDYKRKKRERDGGGEAMPDDIRALRCPLRK